MKIKGYLHVLVQQITLTNISQIITCQLSLGDDSKVRTSGKQSGVSTQHTRMRSSCYIGDQKIAENRFAIQTFFVQPGNSYIIDGDLVNQQNINMGIIKLKLTYYSIQNGKLKLRVFHLSFKQEYAEKFKEAKLKIKGGHHSKISKSFKMNQPFDEDFDIIVLTPTMSLTFDVIHDDGLLGSYSINNISKSNILIPERKAYQVNLFNKEQSIGLIKYQIDWIK